MPSRPAGLNAWIPLLVIGLLSRFTGVIDLTGDWDLLEQTWVLVVLAGMGVADFAADKIPAIDHVLHAGGVVIAPIAGTVAALAALAVITAMIAAAFSGRAVWRRRSARRSTRGPA